MWVLGTELGFCTREQVVLIAEPSLQNVFFCENLGREWSSRPKVIKAITYWLFNFQKLCLLLQLKLIAHLQCEQCSNTGKKTSVLSCVRGRWGWLPAEHSWRAYTQLHKGCLTGDLECCWKKYIVLPGPYTLMHFIICQIIKYVNPFLPRHEIYLTDNTLFGRFSWDCHCIISLPNLTML